MTPDEPHSDSPPLREGAEEWAPPGSEAAANAIHAPSPSVEPSRTSSPGASRAPSRPDPWAHRRAEPRTFAFIWTLFLFAATLTTYAVTMSMGVGSHDVVRPSARMLLAIVAAGMMIVWPMVRLSQLPDPRPIAGPVLDLLVVLVPVQAIIWPQCLGWLAWWPVSVIGAAGASLAAWAAIVAALLSISHSLRHRPGYWRSPAAWMVFFILFFLATLLPAWATSRAANAVVDPGVHAVSPAWMASPVTSMFEFTQDRTWMRSPAAVFTGHWRMISLTFAAALFLWMVAIGVHGRAAGGRPPPGLH